MKALEKTLYHGYFIWIIKKEIEKLLKINDSNEKFHKFIQNTSWKCRFFNGNLISYRQKSCLSSPQYPKIGFLSPNFHLYKSLEIENKVTYPDRPDNRKIW